MSLKLKTASNKLTITDKSGLKLEFLLPANTTEQYLTSMTDVNRNAAQRDAGEMLSTAYQ